jgi:hypothetical protein
MAMINTKEKSTDMSKLKEKSEIAEKEIEIIDNISNILNAGMDSRSIRLIHDLLEQKVHPESIVDGACLHQIK